MWKLIVALISHILIFINSFIELEVFSRFLLWIIIIHYNLEEVLHSHVELKCVTRLYNSFDGEFIRVFKFELLNVLVQGHLELLSFIIRVYNYNNCNVNHNNFNGNVFQICKMFNLSTLKNLVAFLSCKIKLTLQQGYFELSKLLCNAKITKFFYQGTVL